MNAFDYFFENSSGLDKLFLAAPEEITFRKLFETSQTVARWLRREMGRKKNIILISPNNVFFIKSYLSIIKSGNVCIPLDPAIEEENFNYIADLTKADYVFTVPDVAKRLPLSRFTCITPDLLPEEPAIPFSKPFRSGSEDNDCAEVIFTSGSTGKPKGVMISHRNLVANTSSILQYLELNSEDRMLVVLPFYYCYGLSLLHTHLRAGGSIVLNNSFIFLGSVINSLKKYSCTGFAGVPSHFQILMRMSDTFRNTEFPALRYVTQAGGKLATVFIDEFRNAFPNVKFYVMYGQTEATARLSYLPPDLYEHKKGSMGRGIPGVLLKVVRHDGEEVKPGETGEVIARGDNIMLGYYEDAETTSGSVRDGWLWTGDLGVVDDEGYIYLTARKNEIIKVRGKRISPKEVENVILQIPEVVDCSVEGTDDEIEGESLKATIVVNDTSEGLVNPEFIKKHCIKTLAPYKIPSIYEFKKSVTISATGKKIKKTEIKSKENAENSLSPS